MRSFSTPRSVCLPALLLVIAGCETSEAPTNPGKTQKPAATTATQPAAASVTGSAAANALTTTIADTPVTAPAEPISDELLEKYVQAFLKLSRLEEQTQKQLDLAGQRMEIDKIDRLKRDADMTSRAILSEIGITRETYLNIRHRLKIDPELNARGEAMFNRYLREIQKQTRGR